MARLMRPVQMKNAPEGAFFVGALFWCTTNCVTRFSRDAMGPRLREDDGFSDNNIRYVIPAKAGTHTELTKSAAYSAP